MNNNILIAKLQMALGMTNPKQALFFPGIGFKFTCIHCGADLEINVPPDKAGHHDTCIWLSSVLAIGDYTEEE